MKPNKPKPNNRKNPSLQKNPNKQQNLTLPWKYSIWFKVLVVSKDDALHALRFLKRIGFWLTLKGANVWGLLVSFWFFVSFWFVSCLCGVAQQKKEIEGLGALGIWVILSK